MKGNKKVLVAVSFGTYAIYKSSATGNSAVKAADWVITVNSDDIVANDTFTLGDVTWVTHNGKNNTMAPGDTGTLAIVIDATAAEVDVTYSIDLSGVAAAPLAVTAHSGSSLTGNISAGSSVTVTLDVAWATADASGNNLADVGFEGDNLDIPVTVTVSQKDYS